jgi:MFS family permease
LLLLRLLQGIGASALGSINITLIGDLYSGERRNEAMGYNSSILSIGTALYPAIGGLLAAADWHYVFLLPGLILPFAFLIHFKLKVPKPKEPTLFKIYLSKLWKIINQKEAWGLFLSNILVFIILYGVLLTYYPIMLSERFNVGSLAIGISMTLMSGVAALASLQYGRMRKRAKPATLLIASSLLYFCGLLILAIAHSFILIGLAITLFGIGHGLFIPNIQSLLVGMAPLSERAAFMSFNGTILRLGQSLGPVIAALFYFSQNLTLVFIAGALISILIVIVVRIFVWKAD